MHRHPRRARHRSGVCCIRGSQGSRRADARAVRDLHRRHRSGGLRGLDPLLPPRLTDPRRAAADDDRAVDRCTAHCAARRHPARCHLGDAPQQGGGRGHDDLRQHRRLDAGVLAGAHARLPVRVPPEGHLHRVTSGRPPDRRIALGPVL